MSRLAGVVELPHVHGPRSCHPLPAAQPRSFGIAQRGIRLLASRTFVTRIGAASAGVSRPGSPSPDASIMDDFRIIENITADGLPEFKKKECILFYTPDTEPLARKIAAVSPHKLELGNIRWRCAANTIGSFSAAMTASNRCTSTADFVDAANRWRRHSPCAGQ